MKYGIKVPFLFDHDFLWAVRGDSKFQLEPILFNTKQEAEDYALKVFGEHVIVAEYDESQNSN